VLLWGEGISARLIGPSVHPLIIEWFLDGPMIRWPAGPIVAALHYVLEIKGVSRF